MINRPLLDPGALEGVDLADPRLHAEYDLTEVWRHLRDTAPVHRHPATRRGDGFWVITRYDDVATVYKDGRLFSSERGNVLDTLLAGGDSAGGRMLAVTDGAHHTALRSVLNKHFTPRALEVIVDSLRTATWKLIEDAVAKGEGDFAADVAANIPLAAICDLLGVPQSDRAHILSLTPSALASSDGAPTEEGTWSAKNELLLYFSELAASRRAKPYDDVVSLLVTSEVGERPLSHEEIIFNCYSIIMGGNETTRFAMIGGLLELMRNPEQWQALKSGQVSLETAIEEILRYTTPSLHSGRTSTEDCFLGGEFIEAGDIVTVWNASANRDERQFPDPDRFDLARTPNKHLTFAYGPHFCIGAYLARAELNAVFGGLRAMAADMWLTGEPRRIYANFLSGFATLPVSFTPDPSFTGA
ncbi:MULTISPECIES: cytochrome P450 [unclassified Streptomyces]|uniref:cytochrome P450 n=1 Tax=unclassified Streptomyces TaxID=2593676 RepID=UPI002E13A60F|nr:cytochrome P450 [Streptomyces sp. NBC_01197]WSS47255.1 cytochrome P450 [Streptomyces sp. NBC_01180]